MLGIVDDRGAVKSVGTLIVRERRNGPVFEAKWRRDGQQVKRRLGPAWLERGPDEEWRPRRGRMPEGYLDRRRATVLMAEAIAEHEVEQMEADRIERERREAGVTFREVAREWLVQLEKYQGARPSTLQDYGYILAEPGTPHRRGSGVSRGARGWGAGSIRQPCGGGSSGRGTPPGSGR